jgi:hypothetical protein
MNVQRWLPPNLLDGTSCRQEDLRAVARFSGGAPQAEDDYGQLMLDDEISSLVRFLRPDEKAFRGLAGEVVRSIEPHTEADPMGLLLTFLAAFGSAVGAGPYALAGDRRHAGRLFVVLVGATGIQGRKGTAAAAIDRPMEVAAPGWFSACITHGLASGEGLIAALLKGDDASSNRQHEENEGTDKIAIPASSTTRVMHIVEGEFARLLVVCNRDGTTLSPVLRDAWDGRPLNVLTRRDPLRAPRHHVSLVGHITPEELRKHLREVEQANGFANRFLFAKVERSKLLPNGGSTPDEVVAELGAKIAAALARASGVSRMTRSAEAEQLWGQAYYGWAEQRHGVFVRDLLGRPDAQVLRLSVVYALLGGSAVIEQAHLEAALAVWEYCANSVRAIFGSATGNAHADRLYEELARAGAKGLTAAQQFGLFSGNVKKRELDHARELLEKCGLAETIEVRTGGRGRPAKVTRITAEKK